MINSDLWGLEFGNGNAGSTPETLFFTAGINNQQDGLFGSIVETPEPSALLLLLIGLGSIPLMRKKP